MSASEMIMKNLLKGINFPELQEKFLADPRVNQALELANGIRDDFATIKMQNAEILRRLDEMAVAPNSATATTLQISNEE